MASIYYIPLLLSPIESLVNNYRQSRHPVQHKSFSHDIVMSAINRQSQKCVRSFTFNDKFLLPLGLEPNQRDTANKRIVTLSCRFFHVFGGEKIDAITKENKHLATVKNWNGPFTTDYIRLHLLDQYCERWEKYESISMFKMRDYFNVRIPYAEALRVHFGIQDENL